MTSTVVAYALPLLTMHHLLISVTARAIATIEASSDSESEEKRIFVFIYIAWWLERLTSNLVL
ncbi:MAG: hypothetical protein QW215_07355 [Ignisphaera sp.]